MTIDREELAAIKDRCNEVQANRRREPWTAYARGLEAHEDRAALLDALEAAEAREMRLREAGHEMADKLTVLVRFGPHDEAERAAAIRALEMFNAALAVTAP